uniref:Uncharacterized protein n=1 Tax=Daphnia galeata TaxID=27404 RepID=A0A8J2S124_9CRUS|nr:unnamed protein product [Daphnia galeata]
MHKAAESNPQPLRRTHAAEDAFNSSLDPKLWVHNLSAIALDIDNTLFRFRNHLQYFESDFEVLLESEKKNNPGEVVIQSENGERRVLRSTPDWTEEAINGDHLWMPTSASGDLCHVLDQDCTGKAAHSPFKS